MDRAQLPLNALRAFEASARHLNFTRAALELCVSQGAVSQQVAALEAEKAAQDQEVEENRLRINTLEGDCQMHELEKEALQQKIQDHMRQVADLQSQVPNNDDGEMGDETDDEMGDDSEVEKNDP